MLVNFNFKNFRSFFDEQNLSLLAGHDKALEENIISISTDLIPGNLGVLRNITVFGDNEAGKTNLLKTLDFMKKMVFLSSSMNICTQNEPFALHEGASLLDTHIEVEIIQNGGFYKYGFVINSNKIVKEWLFRRSERLTPIFKRNLDELQITGLSKNEATLLMPSKSTLFISIADKLNLPIASAIYDVKSFFQSLEFISSPKREYLNLYLENEDRIRMAASILKQSNLGFSDLKLIKMGSYIDAELTQDVYSDNGDITNKKKVRLFQDQNLLGRGIMSIVCILPVLLKALDTGGTVLMNDLGSTLSVHTAGYLQNFFSDNRINPKGAQMIATSSVSMLMDEDLRRDQIYLVSRDNQGRSSLYRLSDRKNVRKSDVYSKKYLKGEYTKRLTDAT